MSKSVLLSYIIIADDTRIKKRSKEIKNRLKRTHKSTILSGANSQATELSSATGRRVAQSIPVDCAHIPTRETASRWKHLAPLTDRIPPLQNCEVGLLIGYNCSRALAPREVLLGADSEPHVVRTDLGWSMVGPSLAHHESQSGVTMCHRVSIKEIPAVTPIDVIKVLESDFKDTEEK